MTAAASIDSVDGQTTKANASKVVVAPGRHTLAVTCRWGFVHNSQTLELDAVAGVHYELAVSIGGGSCDMKIVDIR